MSEELAEVYDDIRNDPAFARLRTDGIVLVPGEGSSRPNVLIVGEAPGATENTHRRPFVGASGKVLRGLITSCAGLSLAENGDAFITNVVKYRPPNNRTPFPEEIDAAVPYLRREWTALGCPSVIVAVGATALLALAPGLPSVTRSAGKLIGLQRGRWLLPMYHPAYGLRNQSVRPVMEQHWEEFGEWYEKEFKR